MSPLLATVRKFRTLTIVIDAVFVILGLCMILWPGTSALTVCYLAGILCFIAGGIEIGRYVNLGSIGVFFSNDLVLGILAAIAGFLLILHPYDAVAVMHVVLGFYVLIDSIFGIQLCLQMKHAGFGDWWCYLITAVVSAVFGILLIIAPFTGAEALTSFVGISLMVSGVRSFCTVVKVSKAIRSEAPIEADFHTNEK